jgi:hypothetical protein
MVGALGDADTTETLPHLGQRAARPALSSGARISVWHDEQGNSIATV